MGQTPAKTFAMPTPFGSTPQSNNVSQAQPLTQVQGPGFAAFSGFDQTQQQPQQTQSPMMAGGAFQRPQNWMNMNPFKGLLNQ